jgi:hypothetical protein
MLSDVSQAQKAQDHKLFPQMWKLDLQVICRYKYMYYHMYLSLNLSISIVRENKTASVGLSEGTIGDRKGKENVRE